MQLHTFCAYSLHITTMTYLIEIPTLKSSAVQDSGDTLRECKLLRNVSRRAIFRMKRSTKKREELPDLLR